MAKPAQIVLSHWHNLVEGLQESPQNIYSLIETSINEKQLPDVKITRVTLHEAGLLSAKREYLRVRRKEHLFDICAAPFGSGFFFSWWLGEVPSGFWGLMALIPVFGPLFIGWFKPHTYFTLDTAMMFQDSIRQAVDDVVGQIISSKGLRALSELERKPVMSDIFNKIK